MDQHRLIEHIALGAAAGVAATFLLQGLRTSEQKLLPQTMPPMRQDPGEFMVQQAEGALPRKRVSKFRPPLKVLPRSR